MSQGNEKSLIPVQNSALVLSGGGARAAYQAGVLKALAEVVPEDNARPFKIICGTSAGAMNAMMLAAHPGTFKEAIESMCSVWMNLSVERVYRTSWFSLISNLLSISRSLFNQGVGREKPLALLDNSPLRQLLLDVINFDNIQKNIDAGHLHATCINALSYSEGESVSFYQAADGVRGWQRFRRFGVSTRLTVDHLLASSAIPAIFPAVKIDDIYYCDGAIRQMAPISPALHLGAKRVFIVGVSDNRSPVHWGSRRSNNQVHSPSMAQITAQWFNAAFIDSLEGDLEHLDRVNTLLDSVEEDKFADLSPLRPVESVVIEPSQSLARLGGRKLKYLPPALRWLFRSTGATRSGGGVSAASYLLFERPYIEELIELGYQDAMWEKDKLRYFLRPQPKLEVERRGLFGSRKKSIEDQLGQGDVSS
ncbi:patatin-like phospholipase family protein [Microbulbifer sp. PSTR4-B]|uniref:patatin-like phospholipase family protein n=1 Tax=Microbulbifer sp. PSTR4-B TaxID=3243396 RepID=UPI00403A018E